MRKKVAFTGMIVLVLLLVVNIFNYVRTDTTKNVDIQLNKDRENEYLYSINSVESLQFIFEYSNEQDTIKDTLGSYYFNNKLDIKNIDVFNIFKGSTSDNGHIKLSILDRDNCIYLDCFSDSNKSKAMTISKLNLIEDKSFKDYKMEYTITKKNDNTITLFEGISINDASRIRLIASYE